MTPQPEERPTQYVIRLTERALRDIDAAYLWVAEATSLDLADAWLSELELTLAGLSQFPRRYPEVKERFRLSVRQVIYRRQESRIAHRILFTLLNEESEEDAPTVRILHLRHTSRRSLTRRDIREIESSD